MADNVNQPAHYKVGGIEAIDYIAAKLGNDGFRAYCVGNVLKYASRWQAKNGIEDLRKASVYLCWAINGNPGVKLDDSRDEFHGIEAPMPPALSELLARHDDEPGSLKAGEAYREQA
jgi:hypothetical protein